MENRTKDQQRLPGASWGKPKPLPASRSSVAHPRLATAAQEELVGQVAACLTLCAPAAMSIEDRSEWVAVAVGEIAHYPREVLIDACRHARRNCRHPAQIIPAIVQFADEAEVELRRDIARAASPRLRLASPPPPRQASKLTQADVDALAPEFVKLGLAAGFLIRNAAGRVTLAPDGDQ